jgi:predicted Zn-dependent protease
MAKQIRRPAPEPSDPPADQQPQRRSTYVEAVALYEQAIRTLQLHNYAKAADLLRHVVTHYPDERELLDRARLYLRLCERQLEPLAAEPRNTRERLYAATLALNEGQIDRAVTYLNQVLDEEPSNDQACYMLAVAHAGRGEPTRAVSYLQQAIEANLENRALARVDPDLERLRHDGTLTRLLQGLGSRRQTPAQATPGRRQPAPRRPSPRSG